MNCERCGKEVSENTIICPSCGAVTSSAREPGQPPTTYGSYGDPQPMPTYDSGYSPAGPPQPPIYTPPSYSSPQQNMSYGRAEPFRPPPMYQPGPINVTVVNNFTTSSTTNTNSGALIAEIILSLFGIYGVGWLIAGETTTGIVLLVCSFVLFWPLAIMIAIFTIGFGVFFCDLPLAVGGIILNAVLLNNALKRKAIQLPYPATIQAQQMPPGWRPPQ